MTTRRSVLKTAAGGLLMTGAAHLSRAALPAGALESETLESLAGKEPLLKRTFRPPNYETPLAHLSDAITPNNRFFVRWHLANIPAVDTDSWRLKVAGDASSRPGELTLNQLKTQFEPVEVAAVCQCAGNRRGLAEPHAPGVEWANGAVGKARWKGARLKDVLAHAGVKKEAIEIAFDGGDRPVLDATPDFVKSIPAWKALDDNTLIAYEMNGEPLPHWNGFPARIVVPGWVATYWVKQVVSINALLEPMKGYWVNTAYRLPKGKYPSIDRFVSQESETTTPITEVDLVSLMTNISEGQQFRAGMPVVVKGIAWDAGYGIQHVDVSTDAGRTWQNAEPGTDLGRYSFRTWQFAFTPREKGAVTLASRAINAHGMVQTERWIANGAGYRNNVVQKINVHIV
jgi:DMSO/TMAO reductase YedYZ molybdopterin-dependent catalytic subunit